MVLVTSSVTTGYFIFHLPLLLLLRTNMFITAFYYVIMGSLLRSDYLLLRSNGFITTCYGDSRNKDIWKIFDGIDSQE